MAIIDSFEDQNLSEYSGDTSVFDIVDDSSDPSAALADGSFMLKKTQTGNFDDIQSDSGLNAYPQKGDTFRVHFYTEDNTTRYIFRWGDSSSDDFWFELWWQGDGTADLDVVDASGSDAASQTGISIQTDKRYYIEVIWDDGTLGGSDGDITVQVFDASDDSTVSNALTFNSDTTIDGSGTFIRTSIDQMSTSGTRAYVDYIHTVEPTSSFSRSATESVSAFDTPDTMGIFDRVVSEITDINDMLRAHRPGFTPLEVLAVTRTAVEARSETASVVDDAQRTGTLSRAFAETADVIDAVARTGTLDRSFSETATGFDAISAAQTATRAVAETSAAFDSFTRSGTLSRAFTEVSTAFDALSPAKKVLAAFTETTDVIDTFAQAGTFSRVASEMADINDFVKAHRPFFTPLVSVTVTKTGVVEPSETVNVIDSVARTGTIGRAFAETAEIIDNSTTIERVVRALSESVSTADTISRRVLVDAAAVLTETVAMDDTFARTGTFSRAFSETVTIIATISEGARVVLAETVNVQDTLTPIDFPEYATDVIDLLDKYIRLVDTRNRRGRDPRRRK